MAQIVHQPQSELVIDLGVDVGLGSPAVGYPAVNDLAGAEYNQSQAADRSHLAAGRQDVPTVRPSPVHLPARVAEIHHP